MGKLIELTGEHMLKKLVEMANDLGANLKVRKSKKYSFVVCGKDEIGRQIKMGGTAEGLYDELLRKLTDYF